MGAEDEDVPAEQQYITPDRPTRSSLYSTPPASSIAGSVAAGSIAAYSRSSKLTLYHASQAAKHNQLHIVWHVLV